MQHTNRRSSINSRCWMTKPYGARRVERWPTNLLSDLNCYISNANERDLPNPKMRSVWPLLSKSNRSWYHVLVQRSYSNNVGMIFLNSPRNDPPFHSEVSS